MVFFEFVVYFCVVFEKIFFFDFVLYKFCEVSIEFLVIFVLKSSNFIYMVYLSFVFDE